MARRKSERKLSIDELALQISWSLTDLSDRLDRLKPDEDATKLIHCQSQLAATYLKIHNEDVTLRKIEELEQMIQDSA